MNEKRKKRWIAGSLLLLVTISAGIGIWYFLLQGNRASTGGEKPEERQKQELAGQIVAGGSTMVGMVEEKFAPEEAGTDLVIEEVYVSNGDEVEAGSKILKITEESLENAGKNLESEKNRTDLLYRQKVIENQTAQREAEKEYDTALIQAEYAQAEYEANLSKAQTELKELEEALKDAEELYQEYYSGIYESGYEEEYELAEKKEAYETNEGVYWDTLKAWNIEDTEVNNSGAGGNALGQTAPDGAKSDRQQRIEALELIEDTYRAEKEAYEQAKEDCQAAIQRAQAGIVTAQADYELAQLAVEQGKSDYEKKAAVYLADYETAAAEGNAAKSAYEVQNTKLEEELNTLLSNKNSAEENLSVFEEAVGDGYLYTGQRGTIIMVPAEAGKNLEPNEVVLAYTSPDMITATVSVDQKYIASVAIGDAASVTSKDGGSYQGTVTGINPITDSDSKSSVSYSVEITLTGDLTGMSENQTVTAVIGEGQNEKTS